MQTLTLMRHGEAESSAASDAMRNLTAAGRLEVSESARLLIDTCPVIDRMIVSPYLRARQSAAIVSGVYGGIDQLVSEAVTPEVHPDAVLQAIDTHLSGAGNGMIVFHQPIIGRLVYYLSGQDLPMRTAGVVVLNTPVIGRDCCEVKCVI